MAFIWYGSRKTSSYQLGCDERLPAGDFVEGYSARKPLVTRPKKGLRLGYGVLLERSEKSLPVLGTGWCVLAGGSVLQSNSAPPRGRLD